MIFHHIYNVFNCMNLLIAIFIFFIKITVCNGDPDIPGGKAVLENPVDRGLYASAAVLSCNIGFEKKKDYILCLKTGEWEQGACVKLGKEFI